MRPISLKSIPSAIKAKVLSLRLGKTEADSIKIYIQKRLLLRLLIGSVIISSVLSLVVYLNERQRISNQVIEQTRRGVTRFNSQIDSLFKTPGLIDRQTLQSKLDILFIAARRMQETGHFVFIGIYDLNNQLIASVMDGKYPAAPQIKEFMIGLNRIGHPSNRSDAEMKQFHGAPHIYLSLPLFNSENAVVAHAGAVYAISASTVSEIKAGIIKAILTVIAIVTGTTAVLYPLIALLTNRLVRLATGLLDANLETLRVLGSAVAKRDSDTDLHNFKVTVYAVRLAERLNRDAKSIRGLIKGAFLHDVGKVGVSDQILLKPSTLSAAEFHRMKEHIPHGVDIISSSEWLNDAVDVVHYHHENYDGSGYPNGLKGQQIPFNARIFAIIDVFDALTSRRPYKEPYSLEETMTIMQQMSGRELDPELFKAFGGIAIGLYNELASGKETASKEELDAIIERYFKNDITTLLSVS